MGKKTAKQPGYMLRVEHWDFDEPEAAGGIVTLHYGWSFEHKNHEGVMGFDTKKEARERIKEAWKCDCEECQKNKGKT